MQQQPVQGFSAFHPKYAGCMLHIPLSQQESVGLYCWMMDAWQMWWCSKHYISKSLEVAVILI